MSKLLRLFSSLLLSMICVSAWAQMEATLYFMNNLPQVTVNNPAFIPNYKVTVGLPGISSYGLGYANNGFSYNDLIKTDNGAVKVDLSKLGGALTDKNYITQTAHTDLFRFGIKVKSLYLTASVTAKMYNRLMLPKDFTTLFTDGNSQFVGGTANFSLQAESLTYIESALGASYKLTDKLTIGARFKYLKGLSNVTTESSNITVAFADTYQITASADAQVKTSGIHAATQSGFDFSKSYSNYLNNNGVAIDLGANFKVTDKLSVSASLIDIGQISWSNDIYQYSLDKATASYTFSGVDAQKIVKGNTDYFSGISDDLQNKFKFKETVGSSYSTMLPSKIYLGGNYELIKNLNFGALLYSETFRGRVATGMTGSVNKNFGGMASVTLSYTVADRSANNLGAGFMLNFAGLQFYMLGDNLLNAPISLISSQNLNSYINNTKYFSFRGGVNLVFGHIKKESSESGPSGKTFNENKKRRPGRKI